MCANKYVLAMYDVRGKQDYIFRSKKLKEIVGGSLVIRDIFKDELYPAANEYKRKQSLENGICVGGELEAIFNYKDFDESDDSAFSSVNFKRHMERGYLGEVVYDGGGNFFILYKDKEVFEGINKIFTKRVLEHTYSLTVLCSCIVGVDFNDYKGDRDKLYAENRIREARINPQLPAQTLPFTQVEYANSMPLYEYNESVKRKVSRESSRKYSKYAEVIKSGEGDQYDEKILDGIVKEKGSDSWIAVIYIDGNNMGAKVQGLLKHPADGTDKKVCYEDAVRSLREFSSKIQKEYIDDRLAAIDIVLAKKYMDSHKRRLVIHAGDEINIIVNAHDAYDAVKAYFKEMPEGNSACAGIAIFKSHMPYADAYRIAEQCCETGKQLMKKYNMGEVNFVDFHYCQGAIGMDIEKIREREVGDIISKPWLLNLNLKDSKFGEKIGRFNYSKVVTDKMIDNVVRLLNTCTRTNIKGLLECARSSESAMFTELTRMLLRRKPNEKMLDNQSEIKELSDLKDIEGKQMSREMLRKIIYDIVLVYDLWFRNEEKSV